MISPRPWDRAAQTALVALVVACLLVTAAAFGAWRVAPWPASPYQGSDLPLSGLIRRDSSATVVAVLTATERNPFRPDRQRPATRYRLPGERTAASRVLGRPIQRIPQIRLVGIAFVPGRSGLAAIAVPGQGSRLVRVGQDIGGFKVTTVERHEVTLVGADTTLTLTLRRPGSSPTPYRRRR